LFRFLWATNFIPEQPNVDPELAPMRYLDLTLNCGEYRPMTTPSKICQNCGGEKISIYARICNLCGETDEPIVIGESKMDIYEEVNETKVPSLPINHSTAPSGVKETTAQFSHTANHSLVWVVAFIPIAGLILDLILISENIAPGWSFIPVLIFNVLLCKKDQNQLAQLSYDTEPIESFWATLIIPVYLFKRVAVAGGGYGYAVVWMATFSVLLLFPYLQQNGGLNTAQGSEGIEVACQVGIVSNCIFTNTLQRSGSAMCVNVSVRKQTGVSRYQTTTKSELVCSGPMQANDSVQKSAIFVTQQPMALCAGEDFSGNWDDCTVEIFEK